MPPPELEPPEIADEGGEAAAPTARERRASEAEEPAALTPAIATYQRRRGSSTW